MLRQHLLHKQMEQKREKRVRKMGWKNGWTDLPESGDESDDSDAADMRANQRENDRLRLAEQDAIRQRRLLEPPRPPGPPWPAQQRRALALVESRGVRRSCKTIVPTLLHSEPYPSKADLRWKAIVNPNSEPYAGPFEGFGSDVSQRCMDLYNASRSVVQMGGPVDTAPGPSYRWALMKAVCDAYPSLEQLLDCRNSQKLVCKTFELECEQVLCNHECFRWSCDTCEKELRAHAVRMGFEEPASAAASEWFAAREMEHLWARYEWRRRSLLGLAAGGSCVFRWSDFYLNAVQSPATERRFPAELRYLQQRSDPVQVPAEVSAVLGAQYQLPPLESAPSQVIWLRLEHPLPSSQKAFEDRHHEWQQRPFYGYTDQRLARERCPCASCSDERALQLGLGVRKISDQSQI